MPDITLARFDNECALVCPERLALFEASLLRATAEIAKIDARYATEEAKEQAGEDFWPKADSWMAQYRPYNVRDGVLVIPVKGVLLNNVPWALGEYATGYTYISKAFQRGMDDPNVKGIAFHLNTPGGDVAGNFDMVDSMFDRKGEKPIHAYASDAAYSAGYSIASVADRVFVSRTGGVGSIGVVTMHMDASAAVEKAGYKITFIYAGKHKVDGNAYEALKPEVRDRIQARVDNLYSQFVSIVARNRPALSEKAVRATEALTYSADDAIDVKLADEKSKPIDEALAAFAAELSSNNGSFSMSTKDNSAADNTAAVEAARQEGLAQGRKEGADAERARIGAILGSEEAKGRDSLAQHFAFKTGMSADDAKAALSVAPTAAKADETSKAKGKSDFHAVMDQGEHPNVGANNGSGGEESAFSADSFFAAAGRKPRKS